MIKRIGKAIYLLCFGVTLFILVTNSLSGDPVKNDQSSGSKIFKDLYSQRCKSIKKIGEVLYEVKLRSGSRFLKHKITYKFKIELSDSEPEKSSHGCVLTANPLKLEKVVIARKDKINEIISSNENLKNRVKKKLEKIKEMGKSSEEYETSNFKIKIIPPEIKMLGNVPKKQNGLNQTIFKLLFSGFDPDKVKDGKKGEQVDVKLQNLSGLNIFFDNVILGNDIEDTKNVRVIYFKKDKDKGKENHSDSKEMDKFHFSWTGKMHIDLNTYLIEEINISQVVDNEKLFGPNNGDLPKTTKSEISIQRKKP